MVGRTCADLTDEYRGNTLAKEGTCMHACMHARAAHAVVAAAAAAASAAAAAAAS